MATTITDPRRLTTPRTVYLIPAYPQPSFCWMWEWECIADHGERRTVKGKGLPANGQEVALTNPSWVMFDDRHAAVVELRLRLALAIAAAPGGNWSRIDPEVDPRITEVPDDAS